MKNQLCLQFFNGYMYYEMMTTLFDKPNATVEGLLYLHIVFDTIILYPYCPFYEKYSKYFTLSLTQESFII